MEENIKFFDKSIEFKKKKVEDNLQLHKFEDIPLPAEIEISESGTCNRSCSFCPRSDPNYPDIKEFIPTNLIKKLSTELKELNYNGTVRFSGFVEPLLDKNIFNLINILKVDNPSITIAMVTNGDVLDIKRLKKLFSSGLDILNISVYDDEIAHQNFIDLVNKANVKDKVIIRPRYLPEDQDFGITLSNRAGLINTGRHVKINKSCYYPSYTLFIDYNGDALMCPHDWQKKNIIGNFKDKSIMDLWMSQRMSYAREKLLKSDRNFDPCKTCDVHGDLIGSKHAEKWKDHYRK